MKTHLHNEISMKRLILPDLLKGLAALFMVQIHITALFLDQAGRESAFGKTTLFLGGPFAAVVFMVVMGYFIAKNKGSFAQNTLRGVKIFILGFLLNIGLNFHLLLKIKFAGWSYHPLEYIFGVDIFYLAGLSIIILAGLKSLNKGTGWASLILLIGVIALTGWMNEKLLVANHYFVLPFIAGNYPWSYFPLFPWLAYPLAGFVYAKYEGVIRMFFGKRKIISIVLIAAIAVMVLVYFKSGIYTTINLRAYYHHTSVYVLWALGITLLWIVFLHFLLILFPETKVGKFFCYIGKNITLFYVIQWLIIGNIATAIYQSQPLNSYLYWFGSIFIATVFITFLIEKITPKLFRIFKKTGSAIAVDTTVKN